MSNSKPCAKIYFNNVPYLYRNNILTDKNYRKIVKHQNYNPRIIEFVCSKGQLENLDANIYAKFILQCLENPDHIWKDEYERRLSMYDRMLLTIVYSLTDTMVPLDFVRNCYNYRAEHVSGVDPSINHFEQALYRLSGSMLRLINQIEILKGMALYRIQEYRYLLIIENRDFLF